MGMETSCREQKRQLNINSHTESLPPGAASSESGRSWRGRVSEGREKLRTDSSPGLLSSRRVSLPRPDRVWTRLARPRQGLEFADRPCREQLGGGPAAPGSRGCRGGPGRDPALEAAPQARGTTTPCPAAPRAPRGRLRAGAPGCCCSSTRRMEERRGNWLMQEPE
ncbi:uncharacterized protein V5649_008878 [Rhynchonycteris naso]